MSLYQSSWREEELAHLEKVLRKLQPEARMIRTSKGMVQPTDIHTNLFDFEKASESAGWKKN